MISEEKEGIHIYVKEGEKDPLLAKASVHERYIILMNDTLHQQNKEAESKISALESQVEELENQSDRDDKRRNYIKGLLKNFHELHKWNEELYQLESKMRKGARTTIYLYKGRASWHLRLLLVIFTILVGISYEFHEFWVTVQLGSLLLIVASFQISMLKNLILPTFPELEKKVEEIQVLKKKVLVAQDYIHEFIDQQ